MNKSKIDENTTELIKWVKDNNLEMVGEPMAAGYNPPWTIPFLRTNEVMVAVK